MDRSFGGTLFDEMDELFENGTMSSGYVINVTQTPEGTKVHAKVGKSTEANELKSRLQQQYPNTQIEIEGGRSLIREVSPQLVEEKKNMDNKK